MMPFQIIETNVSSRMAVIDLQSKLLEDGIIEINEEFTPETVSNWRNALLYLMSKFTPSDTQDKPIQLHINSPGGEVYSMLGLYDVIQMMKSKGYIISTINVGLAASAASFILMSGSVGYRKSLKNCRTMVHTISSMTYGKIADIIVDTEETKKLQSIADQIICEHADPVLIDKCKYLDFWMGSEEAKDFKIIDEII